MGEAKKTGKVLLRAVEGSQASGVCHYTSGAESIEVSVSAQLPGGDAAQAVFQYGPEKSYTCRPPESIAGPVRIGDSNVAAVWVVGSGKPALFGQIRPGPFDAAEARRKLLDALRGSSGESARQTVKAAGVSAAAAQASPPPRPTNREPAPAEQAVPFPAQSAPLRSVYPPKSTDRPPGPLAKAEDPLLLLQPGAEPSQKGAEPQHEAKPAAAPGRPAEAPAAQQVKAASLPQVKPASAPVKAPRPMPPPPLVVRRAPRPTPRPPVYSPLWDDVSAEFEKMLDTLPQAHPFAGEASSAKIAEVPTGGAVQCYIGSVDIDGMKVFLQAVPARPYARPAGFDHSLVSRSGECYWVKYSLQNE